MPLDPFMVRSPVSRKKQGENNFFGMMQTVATPVSKEEAERRRRESKRSRKSGKRK